MKKMMLSLAATPLLLGTLSSTALAADGFNIFDDVKFNGEVRPRYESADVVDNGVDGATSFTARTSLGIRSNKTFGSDMLGAYLQATSVNNFGYTNYNGLNGQDPNYDVIADPQQARMTQMYMDFKLPAKTIIRAGRQMVNLDNQRFVGAVGWRQMFQTFDALALVSAPVDGLSIVGAYIYGINGIKDPGTVGATETGSAIVNVSYKVANPLKITAYSYLLASIHDTYGLSATGKIALGKNANISYRAEYAIQKDPTLEYRVKDVKADASYMNIDAAVSVVGIFGGVNYEVLSGTDGTDGKTAFTTPLATGHKFNGWADKFLATPTGGLTDANVRIGYKAKGFGKLMGVYHMFTAGNDMATATATSTDLGTETDLLYANKVPGVNGLSGLLKAALYSKGEVVGYTNDVQKMWVGLDYKFSL